MKFLADWGLEILFLLLSTGVLSYVKHKFAQQKKILDEYKTLIEEKREQETAELVELKLEPIYVELENLRAYIRTTETTEKSHINLIIDSYKYRLIQLCKIVIRQTYLTQEQYDQLSEFYKLYEGLGGNGQAKQYYDNAIQLPIKSI